MLEITLAGNKAEFAPGEPIEGRVLWSGGAEPPEGLMVSLIYQTEGRGTQDTVHVEDSDVPNSARAGEHGFRFVTPASPYTFDGTLIALRWFIEASCNDETQTKPIVVSPWLETLRLHEVKQPGLLAALAEFKSQEQQQQ